MALPPVKWPDGASWLSTSLRDDGKKHGISLYPTILIGGVLPGLVQAVVLARDGTAEAVHHDKRLSDKKGSRGWLDARRRIESLRATAVTVTGDREGDIHEDVALRPPGVEVLVHAHHEHSLIDRTPPRSMPGVQTVLGREEERVARPRPRTAAREAVLVSRAGAVTLRRSIYATTRRRR